MNEQIKARLQQKGLQFIEGISLVRLGVLIFTLYMTYNMSYSAWEFAVTALALHYDGLSIAGIIAAVLAPTAALQGFAFQAYTKRKQD